MKHIFATAALALCLASPAGAWVEAESENFILRGDMREGDAESLLRDLEGYRANFLRLVGTLGGSERVKVRIHAVASDAELEALSGRTNVAGVYRTDLDGPVFLLTTEGGFRQGRGQQRAGSNIRRGARRESFAARRLTYHEYAHHLMSAYTDSHYPRWYNEGFAEFLASYSGGKGKFSLGQGTLNQARWLEYGNWIPIRTVLGAVHDYPFRTGTPAQSAFYAQSWLMVHYLQNTPGMAARSNGYFAALNRGEDPLEAFAPAFGMSPEEFETELKRYFAAARLNVTSFESPVNPRKMKVRTRDASDREGALWTAQAAAEFTRDAGERAARLDAAEAALGRTADVLLLRADTARDAGEHARALELAREAHALAPDRLDTLRELGRAEVEAWQEASVGSTEAGRDTLRRALAIDPDDPESSYFLALSYRGAGSGAPDEAVRAARTALGHYRALHFAPANLRLVPMLVAAGEADTVRPVLEDISAWAESPRTRAYARDMLARLEG